MNELQIIAEFIGQYGFPIVCCCVLFWSMEKEREAHKEETRALTKALEDNTVVMTEIKTILEVNKRDLQNQRPAV